VRIPKRYTYARIVVQISHISYSETPANDRYAQKTEKGWKDTKCVRMDRRLNDNPEFHSING
jgi:hypothetical protein